MPLVAVPSATPQARLAAVARWDAIVSRRPDLAPAVALQRQLLDLVGAVLEQVERGRLPRLSLPPRYVAAKLWRSIPALASEPIPIPVAVLRPTLLQLCEALARGGAGDAADHIRQEVEEQRLDTGTLLALSVARDHQTLRTSAIHRGLAPDLLWLVAELAVSPFVFALRRQILEPRAPDPGLAGALAAWSRGYCPACGSWPALAEVTGERIVLRCSFCALAWERASAACIYCDESGAQFLTLTPDAHRADQRLQTCAGCSGYLKSVDVPALSPFPFLAIADLETMDLDMTAMQRGLGRPQVKDVFARK